jgi:hypothetical protein
MFVNDISLTKSFKVIQFTIGTFFRNISNIDINHRTELVYLVKNLLFTIKHVFNGVLQKLVIKYNSN